jgi:uncharacterized caspase-like protein
MSKARIIASILMIVGFAMTAPWAAAAQTSSLRYALVIGNAQYREKPLKTASNDAALIADTLRLAGFDVTGAADLDQDSIRRAFKDFLTKLQEAGPQAIAFVYLAGYGLQYDGENYFIPLDAVLVHASDIPAEAVKVSEFTQALMGTNLQARIFVLDAARDNVFPTNGSPLATGLALPDVDAGSLYALDAAPGTVVPEDRGNYGAYAQALAEMLRYGGLPLDDVFARTRLRVNEVTHGAFLPWNMSKLTSSPILLKPAGPEGAAVPAMEAYADLQGEPLHDFTDPTDAYGAAIAIDSLASYQEFLAAFPWNPLCGPIEVLFAHRREALTWNRAHHANRPDAYWSYMQRYPDGPHVADAQRLLTRFSAPAEPPARFDPYDFQGLPPPMEGERNVLDHPELAAAGGPNYAPVPTLSERFLPPLPMQFKRLPQPEPRAEGFLPAPMPIPLVYARPAARLGNLAAPNFQAQQPSSDLRRAGEEPAHALPNPGTEEGRLGEARRGEVLIHSPPPGQRPVVPARGEAARTPRGNFVALPHAVVPMRPAGEVH